MGRTPTSGDDMAGISELRTNVLVALEGASPALVAVTSPRGDVTRRDAAAALAASAERTGRQVAFIDADVTDRRSSSDADSSTAATGEAPVASDAALLAGQEFQRILADAASANDLVVVACPPVLDVAETRAIAATCTGTVLVASQRTSRRDDAVQAAEVLRAAGARIFGVVLRRS